MAVALEMTLDQFARAASRVPVRLDLRAAMASCALAAKGEIIQNFQAERSPDGNPWPAMKRPRDRARDRRAARRGGQQKLLQDRGLLRASYIGGVGAQGHIEEVGPVSFAVGSNLDHAGPHHFGAMIHKPTRRRGPGQKPWVFRGNGGEVVFTRTIRAHTIVIPARPAAGWNQNLLETCESIVLDHAERVGAGFLTGR